MIVDVHSHAFPEPVIALLREPNDFGIRVEGDRVSSGAHANHALFPALHDPAEKLKALDARGLQGAILSIAPRLFCYELDVALGEAMCAAANQGLREMAAADPARLRWMGHVPLADPARAAAVVDDVAAAGAVGVEIATAAGPGRRIDEPEFDVFWAAVAAAGLPVLLHPAYIAAVPGMGVKDYYLKNVIGNPLETTICVERLLAAGVFDRHPELRVVLAHGGGFFPYQAGRLAHAKTVRSELANAPADPWSYVGRIVFDTITHDPIALRYLIDRAGAENVVIGTDHPYDMADDDPLATLRAACAGDDALFSAIAEGAPERLFGAVGVAS